jgi:hypothetical protein
VGVGEGVSGCALYEGTIRTAETSCRAVLVASGSIRTHDTAAQSAKLGYRLLEGQRTQFAVRSPRSGELIPYHAHALLHKTKL